MVRLSHQARGGTGTAPYRSRRHAPARSSRSRDERHCQTELYRGTRQHVALLRERCLVDRTWWRCGGTTPDPRIPRNGNPPCDDKAGRSTYRGARALLAIGLDTPTRLTLNVHGFRETGLQQQGERAPIASNAYPADADYTYVSNVVTPMRKTGYGGAATLTHALSDTLGLVVVGGYEHLAQRYDWNDGTPVRTYGIDYRDRLDQGSVEARLRSTASGPLEWTVGGAWFRDRIRLISVLDGSDVFRTVLDINYL